MRKKMAFEPKTETLVLTPFEGKNVTPQKEYGFLDQYFGGNKILFGYQHKIKFTSMSGSAVVIYATKFYIDFGGPYDRPLLTYNGTSYINGKKYRTRTNRCEPIKF